MVNISLQFIAGGFHATPWGRHVNEGAVEWPPSQWRLLRALISIWHLKFRNEIERKELSDIIEQLSELPEYHLPSAALRGTRHYMPGHAHRQGVKTDVSLVLDTSISLGKEEKLNIYWADVSLSEAHEQVLRRLVDGISYLGRAESWVSAKLETTIPEINCSLAEFENSEKVLSSCCFSTSEFAEWYTQNLDKIEDIKFSEKKQKDYDKGRDTEKTKFTKKDKTNAIAEIPSTLLDALEVSTAHIRKSGWSIAPALKQVVYYRRRDCFDSKPQTRQGKHNTVTAVRYAVASAVLPRMTDAVSVGERVRIALMSISGKQNEGKVPAVFSGKTENGQPLKTNHQHGYYLSESCGGGGKISHVTVFSKEGFNREATQALLSIRRVWGRSGYDLQLIPVELGSPEELGGTIKNKGKSPLMASSTCWESITPFYPARHPKPKAENKESMLKWISFMKQYYTNEVLRELDFAGFPKPLEVEILPEKGIVLDGHLTSLVKFNAKRNGSGKKANITPVVVKLRFSEPVQGPIAIGYSAHYGLGCFKPTEDKCL